MPSRFPSIVARHEADILEDWLQRLKRTGANGRIGADQLRGEAAAFLRALVAAVGTGSQDPRDSDWSETREVLDDLSRSRARHGISPSETAMFVFSLKEPVFACLRAEIGDASALADEIWQVSVILDELGLHTMEAFQKGREEIIARQEQELLDLSTPVTRLWEGVLAVPLIGTLDSARTQVVMESLLDEIVQTGASIAVMDITGVPAVDTLVAQHLLKTVAAARLMGAECIISGIRPQIAQTIVHLGVDLGDVVTKATLADAFRHALAQLDLEVRPIATGPV
jgi:rsbT co-antagonist protein RsbR